MAPAFVGSPAAQRMRHDVMVSSAHDDFDSSRRRARCVDEDDDAELADRDGMIPHYRIVPSAFGPGVGGEWVTLSKTVLLQLVERICQLSFQTDALPAAAAVTAAVSPVSSDHPETSTEMAVDAVESASSAIEVQRPDHPSMSSSTSTGVSTDGDDVADTSASGNVEEISGARGKDDCAAEGHKDSHDVPASDTAAFAASTDKEDDVVTPGLELGSDAATQEANRDDDSGKDDSEIFTAPVAMQSDETENSSSFSMEIAPSTASNVLIPEDPAVSDCLPVAARKPPPTMTTTTPMRSDRRRRLRELRRLRRRHLASVNDDDPSRDRCRCRRRDLVVRRSFAVPRQPPPPSFQDRQIADAERHRDWTVADASSSSSSMRLQVGCRYGRLSQPWSALNKLVVCQLVDVVLSQELTPTPTVWRSAAATPSVEKRRPSGTIWNPAITPETRKSRPETPPYQLPPAIADLPFVDAGSSTLLHTLLSPMAAAAAATRHPDRRWSADTSVAEPEVGDGGSLAWAMSQSTTSLRRRHHSATTSDTFPAPPWTQSFFLYNPTQGNIFLLPDAPGRPACYPWLSPALPTPTSAAVDAACALDYRARTLDSRDVCPDVVDSKGYGAALGAAAVSGGPSRHRSGRTSTSSRSGGAGRGSSSSSASRLKWVVVNKTDVCSLFESLASSMVADGDDKRTPPVERVRRPTTTENGATPCADPGSDALSPAAIGEPIKWKSTLLRRARAEELTPKRTASDEEAMTCEHDCQL